MFSSVLNPIQSGMREHPQRLAIINDGGSYTFAQLGYRVEGIRQALQQHKPHCVMIYGHKQLDAAAAMLACAFEAIPFTFVDIANPPARLAHIIDVTQADLLLLTCPPRTALPQLSIPTLATASLPDMSSHHRPVSAVPEQVFYILTTSGSTGEPKGVKITHGNYDALARWAMPLLHGQRSGVHVNHACLSFDLGIMDIFLTLAAGKTLAMLDHINNIRPRKNLSLLTQSALRIDSWFSTPGFLDLMCSDPDFNQHTLPDLTCLAIGGEALLPPLVHTLQQRFPHTALLHCYGPTEATCMTHAARVTLEDLAGAPPLSLGSAGGNGKAIIVDEHGEPLPAGTTGEIVLFGPQISPGYLPETDPRNRLFGWRHGQRCYQTGDLGYLDAQGNLFVKGRNDGQIKWQGNRIETGEIEAIANQLTDVQQAAVIVGKRDNRVTELMLFVHLSSDTHEKRIGLRRDLAQRLPAYMVPRVIHFTGPFPLTLHGKTDRQALMRQVEADAAPDSTPSK
ncbi:AMP-binding protein [Dickeya chrysanthemi]|uniref:AMP-binding protein n=1 Tax=Dickeya chrysanthemi TaxID=556 RepID=UPI0025A043EE|nr:AMP-binding protein [Dickeya chrysanthemi]WJM85592.1 AMP-binding protein [Dickeya chrysanthemi]